MLSARNLGSLTKQKQELAVKLNTKIKIYSKLTSQKVTRAKFSTDMLV